MKSKYSRQPDGLAPASATRANNNGVTAEELDTSNVLKSLICRYRQRGRPISVNFRRFLPVLNATDRFTHLIHPYPAKLLVHIPFFFLANDLLSEPGDIVLDPFCGSGTVLLEARLASRRGYGVDANPLARLIARVKTTPLDTSVLKRALTSIMKRFPREPSRAGPDVVNLAHWFYPCTARQLQCLQESIEDIRPPAVRDFFLVCLSVCVRKVSLADPRLSVPVRLRFGQYPASHPLNQKSDAHLRALRRARVYEIFAQITSANIARMARFTAHSAFDDSVDIVCSDARHLIHEYSLDDRRDKPLPNDSVQLIITSPPYPGAQKYIRSCSLSLGWLRLCTTVDLRACKARIIGREEFTKAEYQRIPPTNIPEADKLLVSIRKRSPVRAAIATTYLIEMRIAIREMCRVLKSGGHIVLIAANSHICGKQFRTVDYLIHIAEACGLSLSACFIDAIKSRGLMTKRNKTASVITREWVLIFTKGELPQWML